MNYFKDYSLSNYVCMNIKKDTYVSNYYEKAYYRHFNNKKLIIRVDDLDWAKDNIAPDLSMFQNQSQGANNGGGAPANAPVGKGKR